jgi:ATP-dependent DNA helicase RecG
MSSAPLKTPAEQLATPVQFLKGVGPQRGELLAKLDLHYARDLLFFFPRTYQDMSELKTVDQLEAGELASVVGVIEEIDVRNTGPGRSILGCLIRQETQYLRCVWFNQAWMREKLPRGRRVMVSGEPKLAGLRWEMSHPRVELLADDEDAPAGKILPVYSLTEGVNQTQMRRIVQGVVESHASCLDDVFPPEFLDAHSLWPIQAALPQIHRPANQDSLNEARRRFIYQELLVLQLALCWRKWQLTHERRSPALPTDARIDARITRLLPFSLTNAQRQAIDEVAADMGREHPMNRLLQGDVGSGKTVVAIYAMLLAVAHGRQAALMAPTEILARQHFRTLSERLKESRVRFALLTGALSLSERKETLAAISRGEVDLVIGTHAVANAIRANDVQFARLGLVIVDEQHKFGVRQRAALKSGGIDPHYLVMTATPIPRTVALTLFGDLEVSTLREPPPGRQKVNTYWAGDERRLSWWQFFRKQLREGRQGYVIAPLVEESENIEAAGAEQLVERLRKDELEGFRVGLLTGRMTPAEKDQVMLSFSRGQTQVLVATPVIEVGVDVPNATLMTIESGERFGLSQLHQLRGRISRGAHPGYCCVFASPQTEDAQQRLEAFAKTSDGFELAELDFALRGPGDLLGSKQHGLPPLRIADLVRDASIVEEARRDAQALLAADPELHAPAFARLRRMVLVRYGEALELGDVG